MELSKKKQLVTTHFKLMVAWNVNKSIFTATCIYCTTILNDHLILCILPHGDHLTQIIGIWCNDLRKKLDVVQRLFNLMKKEKLTLKIARKINKRKGKLESFHSFHCIRNYFYHLSIDDLERIARQYGIST